MTYTGPREHMWHKPRKQPIKLFLNCSLPCTESSPHAKPPKALTNLTGINKPPNKLRF